MTDRATPDTSTSTWQAFVASRSESEVVTQYCPERPYVELRIPLELGYIHRIVFKIDAHDQGKKSHDIMGPYRQSLGFSDDTSRCGTYEGSNSWFEVTTITPSGHDRTSRLRLASNLHGDYIFREQTISWERGGTSPGIQTWLDDVQPGDTVQIIPRAHYIAWKNFVRSAEIQIEGEVHCEPRITEISSATLVPIEHSSGQRKWHGFYRPLDQSKLEIRVIKIHSGRRDDNLVCAIQTVALVDSHRIPYEALSYCWGGSTRTKSVQILDAESEPPDAQQYVLEVTSNLHDALCHVRSNSQTRVFWIDAICINQNDVPERSWQVAIMCQVYSFATGVIVWLGPSNPGVKDSIEDAKNVAKRYRHATLTDLPQATTAELHRLMFDEHGTYHIQSPLFQFSWFRRTWVLQEVFNAKSVSVYCGEDVLPWSLVLRMNQCISSTMLYANPMKKDVLSPLLAGLFELKTDRNDDENFTAVPCLTYFGIFDTILRGLDLGATDPRDKIFALLSFDDETKDINRLPSIIAPDYSKSVSRVFADFTRWWISKKFSLRILSSAHVSAGRTWQSLSSYPPLKDPERASWSLWHDGKAIWSRGTLGLLPRMPPFCASGTSCPNLGLINSSPSPMVLRLQGLIIGTISEIGAYPYYKDYTANTPIHTAYMELFDPLNTRGIWRSITLRTELLDLQGVEDDGLVHNKVSDHYHAHHDRSSQTGAVGCHQDAFFTTSDGDVGLCPAPANVGDTVVILHGGDVPYLLRAASKEAIGIEGDLWMLVGECYLEGFMYGQAMKEGDEHGTRPSHVFNLI